MRCRVMLYDDAEGALLSLHIDVSPDVVSHKLFRIAVSMPVLQSTCNQVDGGFVTICRP